MRLRTTLALLLALGLGACQSSPPSKTSAKSIGTTPATNDLSREEALARKSRLSEIVYNLTVDIASSATEFTGQMQIEFNLSDASKPLRLDLFEGKIAKIEVNDHTLSADVKKAYWFELPASALKAGKNIVKIDYTRPYANDGSGLHRFQDPEDKKVYLYTQFETFEANRFMPCFDQPDLRAQLKMQVLAPKGYQVITATRETKITPYGQHEMWDFPTSAKISTYLFSLHAGNYKVYSDRYKNIPLRLFVRQSLSKHLKPQDWFTITKQGFAFFEKEFAQPYPFKKYDQVIAPEFNGGGMENVAAVTYTEWMVPRSAMTRELKRDLAGLLLHEMAHMWFGDLVTMQWWNDLWLNESFATLLGNTAVAESTIYKEQWQEFAALTKRGAYTEDALKTTHPIEAPVNTVKEADAIFDAITYNKGASVMKQLRFYMTPQAFRRGVQVYFKRHAYQNTSLADFIAALQTQTKQDLSLWADRWLRQSGTDNVQAEWSCEGSVLKQITLHHTPSVGAQFRPQALEVGLFTEQGKVLKARHVVRAEFVDEKPLVLKGSWSCPRVVYPNFNDHGYVNVQLDKNSLAVLKSDLHRIDDKIVRSLAWNDFWRMVRNFEMPLRDFISVVEANFPAENDEIISDQVATTIANSRRPGSILGYWPTHTPELLSAREKFRARMEENFLKRLSRGKPGSDEQKFWFDRYLDIAQTPKALEQMSEWFKTGKLSNGFALDEDRQWGLVQRLMRFGYRDAEKVLAEMRKRDSTDRGLKAALTAQALVPGEANKAKWIGEALDTKTGSQGARPLQEVSAIMWGLFPQEQWPTKDKFESRFYDFFAQNKTSEDFSRVRTILYGLNPLRCEKTVSDRLQSRLNAAGAVDPDLQKGIKIGIEEDERCQKIRGSF